MSPKISLKVVYIVTGRQYHQYIVYYVVQLELIRTNSSHLHALKSALLSSSIHQVVVYNDLQYNDYRPYCERMI